MFPTIIICCYLLLLPAQAQPPEQQVNIKCATGYMTDVQSWVDEKGALTDGADFQASIDISGKVDPVPVLQQIISGTHAGVKYLSMARCKLTEIPSIFQMRDPKRRKLADTVGYMTFYGNNFQDINSPGYLYEVSTNATRARQQIDDLDYLRNSNAAWSIGLREIKFTSLKELDLRACSLQVLSGNIFKDMPTLEALYLGENEVVFIEANAFSGLKNLIHLDISRNEAYDDLGNLKVLTTETSYFLRHLKSLTSLDLSHTRLSNRHLEMLRFLGPKFSRLSLCYTGLASLDDNFFNTTSLKILDLSGNNNILSNPNVLRGLEDTLEVIYAKETNLNTVDMFKGFEKLKILILDMNQLSSFDNEVAETLTDLRILDLNRNRLTTWFENIFSLMPKLELLLLKDNNVNIISDEMMVDLENIRYLILSGNFIVCNCNARDLMELALRNEKDENVRPITGTNNSIQGNPSYHKGFFDYNQMVSYRGKVYLNCTEDRSCNDDFREDIKGKFMIIDFYPNKYSCLDLTKRKSLSFFEVAGCNRTPRKFDAKAIGKGRKLLYALLAVPFLLIFLSLGFVFRRNIRYFYITMRNSALLSTINTEDVLDENVVFHYDVFVSYCNEDRSWVLDHLLPHMEKNHNFSACLHERDFQVGLSILENIVSCMDRSRSIMLIVSRRFLLSQWCQFEMHLAQHRLLETRREDLTLVFLEEIPRRLRPNTLHYLMLTKTYIVWPSDENDRTTFWRRLMKTIVTNKTKQTASESIA